MEHMEALRKWADVDRLQSCRTLLRTMNKLSGIRSSETWIDARINSLRSDAPLPQVDEPQHVPCAPVQYDAVMQIFTRTCTRLRRGTAEHSAMLSAQALEIWDRPGYREKQGASSAALWESDEYREKISEARLEMWARPGHKEKAVANMVIAQQKRRADPKDEASRQACADKRAFKRSDDPEAKKKWDTYVAAAEAWASNVPAFDLDIQYHNSFIILHLDGRQYNYSEADSTLRVGRRRGPPSKLTDVQQARISKDFFDKASTDSGPFLNAAEVKVIAEEIGMSIKDVRYKLAVERDLWLRAAAMLRRKGVVIDYARIDHLAWMA